MFIKQSLLVMTALSLLSSSEAFANQAPKLIAQNVGPTTYSANNFEIFTPRAQTKSTTIDYSIWDDAMALVVLDLGPSLRKRAAQPPATIGSRFKRGHQTPYRLEGSRFTFAYLTDDFIAGLTDYRKDLQDIGSRIDIVRLSRNEQLAFWLNLHNVALIEKIAQSYPTERPEDIKVDVDGEKVKLHDAKFITVKGQQLSLRDIRENVVYKNWSNPNVIYGFFRGDIGGPKLPRAAYSATNLDYHLNANAVEFVNSLRGFHEGYKARKISAIYEDAGPFFFTDFEADLTAHLLKYAERETIEEVRSGHPFKVDKYDNMIADLSGGRRLGSSGTSSESMSAETRRLLSEVRQKQIRLRARGITGQGKGYVIIEDLVPENQESESEGQ